MATYEVKLNGVVVGTVPNTGDQVADAAASQQLIKDLGLHKEISKAQRALGQARAFAGTASQLYERGLKMGAIVPTTLVPFVVNSAFAIELYLKALSEAHGLNTRGHVFVRLFDPLPTDTRDRLKALAPQFAQQYKAKTFVNFRAALTTLEGAFVAWRYLYEDDRPLTYDVPLAIAVLATLHERCREVVPAMA
ncbi:hypothetical protein J2W24_005501 [Variovorax boronicumulans]|uniref:hypothetical protein n=1 Tax=Variovorax boronicumulans TaxID=436515 RepID=UPI002781047D|nr:hypothetical protein [Variovorax boronicumulans]MDP9919821.1 hypothetical protein [Variovorax boronicumulans]